MASGSLPEASGQNRGRSFQGTVEPRKPLPGYSPTPEEREVIQRVEDRIQYTGRDNNRWALERQMFETIAFYCGIQWIEYSESQRRFMRWSAPAWFPTPMTNVIGPHVGLMSSALARSQPQGRVRPNTNEPADFMAAKVAEKLVGRFYDVTDEDELRDMATLMAALTGTCVAEDWFNPRAGKVSVVPRMNLVTNPVMEPISQCPSCNAQAPPDQVDAMCQGCGAPGMALAARQKTWPDGTPISTSKMQPELDENGEPGMDYIPEGEIESRVRMLMNFYWDPKATKLKDARWCGEACYVDLDWIDENYPDLGPHCGTEEGIDQLNFYEASLIALIGPSIQGTAHYGATQFFRHGCVLRKYQEKPSQKYPQGLFAIVANGVLLHSGPLPITDEHGVPTGDFNYTEFRYDVVPGRFAGRTPAEDMVPLQKRINGIDAQIILNRKTMLSPWILAPKGSGLDPTRQHMRPGATVLYNFVGVGAAPQVVPGTPLPATIMEERNGAIQAMDQLAQDATAQLQQDAPAGTRSGIAMNFAKEAREEVTIPRLRRWGRWIAERDRKKLLLAQRYYREPRIVKVLGVGNEYQAQEFQGSDLRGNTDVTVDQGSLIWRSQSARQQAIMDAIEAQIIKPDSPMIQQKLIEQLGIEGWDTDIGPDQRRAKKENATMDEGGQVNITPVDDHDTHLYEHNNRMKDPSFDTLPPAARQAYQAHTQQHQQAQQQAQQGADQADMQKLGDRIKIAAQEQEAGVQALIADGIHTLKMEKKGISPVTGAPQPGAG
jgi:hypothetical protein